MSLKIYRDEKKSTLTKTVTRRELRMFQLAEKLNCSPKLILFQL